MVSDHEIRMCALGQHKNNTKQATSCHISVMWGGAWWHSCVYPILSIGTQSPHRAEHALCSNQRFPPETWLYIQASEYSLTFYNIVRLCTVLNKSLNFTIHCLAATHLRGEDKQIFLRLLVGGGNLNFCVIIDRFNPVCEQDKPGQKLN